MKNTNSQELYIPRSDKITNPGDKNSASDNPDIATVQAIF